MARKCENCDITLKKKKYWNEFPPTKHSFFKIMPENFEDKLYIPKKFTECFKGKLGSWCNLVGPSGNTWSVGLSRAEGSPNNVVFSKGWPGFVRDHGIELRDFLVFSYIGDLSFEVVIFDASGCERELSYFSRNTTTNEGRSSTTSAFHCSEEMDQKAQDEDHGEDNESEDESSGFKQTGRLGKSNRAKMSKMYYKSNRRAVDEVEKKRAIKKAEEHQSMTDSPTVLIIMKPTYVYRGFNMTIPKKWALDHMLHKPHEVELRDPISKTSWIVGCRWTGSQQCQLRKNWPTFVLDNNLEEHDVCVFELIAKDMSRSKVRIHVHIYRASDEVVPLTVSRETV